ncbi:MAG: HEAT repeat domain-containing protein [Nitrospirae bacterium]|nr:HEAT repeat domain-containing protein [Nitrospirota bacterium]
MDIEKLLIKRLWIILLVVLSLNACKKEIQVSGEDYNIHILHLNYMRFGEEGIGFNYASEKFRQEGEKFIPLITGNLAEKDPFLVMSIKELLMKMPETAETLRALKEVAKYESQLLEKYSRFQEKSGNPRELVFDDTVHWYHRGETAAKLIDNGTLPIADLFPLLQSKNVDDQRTAISALSKIANIEYIQKKIGLITKINSKRITEQSKKILIPLFFQLFKSPDPEIGRRAALILGWFEDVAVVPELIKHIPYVDPFVQEGIVAALAVTKDSRAIDPLLALLRNGSNLYIRASAADALEEFQNPTTIKSLFEALSDKEWLVRLHSLITLESYQDLKVIDPFVKRLSDEHAEVRVAALNALGKFGTISLKDTVSKYLNDSDEEVRTVAEQVIYKFEHGEWPERGD